MSDWCIGLQELYNTYTTECTDTVTEIICEMTVNQFASFGIGRDSMQAILDAELAACPDNQICGVNVKDVFGCIGKFSFWIHHPLTIHPFKAPLVVQK